MAIPAIATGLYIPGCAGRRARGVNRQLRPQVNASFPLPGRDACWLWASGRAQRPQTPGAPSPWSMLQGAGNPVTRRAERRSGCGSAFGFVYDFTQQGFPRLGTRLGARGKPPARRTPLGRLNPVGRTAGGGSPQSQGGPCWARAHPGGLTA